MITKIKDILRLNDLSEQEIAVYIALLTLQKATIPMLREQSGLPNITVYRCMKNLEERRMVDVELINKKQACYKPLTLEKLIVKVEHAQRKLRRLELELKNLDSLLPYIGEKELKDEEEIEVRAGLDAFREEYLKMPDLFEDEYLHIGCTEAFWETARWNYESPEERSFIHRRMARNIYGRVVDPYTPTAEMIQKNDSREKRTLRIVNEIPVKRDILMIAAHQVSHFVCDVDNPRVVIIRNPALIALHKAQFEALWSGK